MSYQGIPPATGGTVTIGSGLSGDGSAGSPLKLDPGTRSTAGSNVQDLTLSGLTGDTAGGYRITGAIITPAAAAPEFYLYLNGAAAPTGASSGLYGNTTPALFGLDLQTDQYIASVPTAEAYTITFTIDITSKQEAGSFRCSAYAKRGVATTFLYYSTAGSFTLAAELTSVGIHGTLAGSIMTNSFIRAQPTGFTA